MGYDVTTAQARFLVAELAAVREQLPPADPGVVEQELDVLGVVADLAELSRARPPLDLPPGEEVVHSPREHFHKYLRSLDADREGLPDRLRRSLERALAHYGADPAEPGPALADAAYRIYLAQERSQAQFPAVAALLSGNIGDIRNSGRLRRRSVATLEPVAGPRRNPPSEWRRGCPPSRS